MISLENLESILSFSCSNIASPPPHLLLPTSHAVTTYFHVKVRKSSTSSFVHPAHKHTERKRLREKEKSETEGERAESRKG